MNLAELKAECLTKAKLWLQIDFIDQDTLLNGMIGKAIEYVEEYTKHRLYERVITLIDYSELVEIYDTPFTLVTIKDKSGTVITDYEDFSDNSAVKYLFKVDGEKVITFNTGIVLLTDVKDSFYEAINKIVAYNYENRLPTQIIPSDVKETLAYYRRVTWF